MQIEKIQEIIIHGCVWYLYVAAIVFIGYIIRDRYDVWSENDEQDHTSFSFYMSVMMYAYFSLIWLPYLLEDPIKYLKSKLK